MSIIIVFLTNLLKTLNGYDCFILEFIIFSDRFRTKCPSIMSLIIIILCESLKIIFITFEIVNLKTNI